MGVIFSTAYELPVTDQPLTHARIAHSRNWLSGGGSGSSTATGYFDSAPNNSLTYERWKPSTSSSTWDLTASGTCDYCCIAAHTLGTSGCSVRIERFTGSGWAALTATTAVSDDMPIMAIFPPETATKWRVTITGGTPEIGVIKFGRALQMPQPFYGGHTPIDLARQTMMRANMSETGEFLGRTKQRTYSQSSFAWAHLEASWVRTNWRTLQKAVETEPFFIAWRPITFSEVAFGQTSSIPTPTNMGIKDLMAVELSMTARGYD